MRSFSAPLFSLLFELSSRAELCRPGEISRSLHWPGVPSPAALGQSRGQLAFRPWTARRGWTQENCPPSTGWAPNVPFSEGALVTALFSSGVREGRDQADEGGRSKGSLYRRRQGGDGERRVCAAVTTSAAAALGPDAARSGIRGVLGGGGWMGGWVDIIRSLPRL